MSRIIVSCCTVLGLCIVFASPPAASGWSYPWRHGWYHRRSQPQTLPVSEPVSLQGVVKSITATEIEVLVGKPADADSKNPKNKPHGTWSVAVPRHTPIHVSGEATPDYLHPGLMVQFTVSGRPQDQQAVETIHQLSVVTAASHGSAQTGSMANRSGEKAAPAAAKKQQEGKTIVGQLGHLHGNQWPVVASGKTRQITLADDVTIKVTLTGSSLVSPGDKIAVRGEMVHGKPGTCIANDVQVTLGKPLQGSKGSQQGHKPDVRNANKT